MRGLDFSRVAAVSLLVCPMASKAADTPPPVKPAAAAPIQPAAKQTLQQMFDQASEAVDRGDCRAALPVFERLMAAPSMKQGTLPAATIDVRQGVCLEQVGRADDAERSLSLGLPILRAAGASMAVDVSLGEQALGQIAMRRHDHDGALTHLKRSMEPLTGVARVDPLAKMAQVTQFDGGTESLGYVEEALRLAGAAPKPDRQSLTALHTIRGRILLNQGRNKEGLADLKQALGFSGGLTLSKVSLTEASMRGDLAEAALLTGDKEQARVYLAYTGAGRIKQSPFASATSMMPPQCGPETGLRPSDFAIVEFGIDDAGDVPIASTVYTRGTYAVATAFAKAVEQWYWRPEDLAKIPYFYRAVTRVEVRCSKSGGDLPDVIAPLRERFGDWATTLLGELDFGDAKTGSNLETLAALATQREREGNLPAAAAAYMARGLLDMNFKPEPSNDFDHAWNLASGPGVPVETRNALVVFRAIADQRRALFERRRAGGARPVISVDTIIREYPALTEDALASDTLFLLTTPTVPSETQRSDAISTLSRVADDERLAEHHPLRQVALLRLANMAATTGKLDEANGYFKRTGLSEEQCSLIGVTPQLTRSGAGSEDFPQEALMYGFEGWVNLEYDITADGKAANARAVIAYPPFVFVDAATGISRSMRFSASYRPSNSLACSASRQTISFRIPQNH